MINRRRMQSWSTINALILILALTSATLAAQILPLGSAHLVAKPSGCAGETCYLLDVDCEQILETGRVTLKVGDPSGRRYRGTIIFATGGQGTRRWQDLGRPAGRTLRRLQKRGYRTVQIAWDRGWLTGTSGPKTLACRPATVAAWVWFNLHDRGAYCAAGNSAGSSQIAYGLAHYGLSEILTAAVLTGGPPLTDIAEACLDSSDTRRSSRRTIDQAYPGHPCGNQDDSYRGTFDRDGIISPGAEYDYPDTPVWFVFGTNDRTQAVDQGLRYYDKLSQYGWPGLSLVRAGHAVPRFKAGAREIFNALTEICR